MNNEEAKEFFGGVFDGRYVYFVPYDNGSSYHGNVLRFDTSLPFTNPDSWSAYDAENTNSLDTKGFYGGVFDGRYVYFVPNYNGLLWDFGGGDIIIRNHLKGNGTLKIILKKQ